MGRYRRWFGRLTLVGVGTAAWAVGLAAAVEPTPVGSPGTPIQLAQDRSRQPPPPAPTPGEQPAPAAPTPGQQPAPTPQTPTPSAPTEAAGGLTSILGSPATPRAPETVNTVGSTTSVSFAGANAAPTLAAPDLGELLSKSPAAAGVEVQRRNAVSSDPRIRGYRVGQSVTLGDEALFFPARQDLDTAVAKFDPGTIRDIIIVKGPYSALYGPGFAFLDIATLDSPRFDCFQVHGRSAVGYQTNGNQWDGLQAVSVGDQEWGFRATYDGLTGSAYHAGHGPATSVSAPPPNGHLVPLVTQTGINIPIFADYNSHNVNYALGVNLTENSKLEFKGLFVHQGPVEYPGLYFDIETLNTQAYNVRYTLDNQAWFDRLSVDAWYNGTAADGDTQHPAKQAFVQQLLFASFNFPTYPYGVPFPPPPFNMNPANLPPPPGGYQTFNDFSSTHFSDYTIGYRAALNWGTLEKGEFNTSKPLLTVGSDLNVLGQKLDENILFQQIGGLDLNTGQPVMGPNFPLFTQHQSIPRSTWTDPGLFAQLSLPVNDRLKGTIGGRVDFVHTDSDPRLITGNINIFGPASVPFVMPTAPPNGIFVLDPIVYSSNPSNTSLSRQFNLISGFGSSEYKLTEHLTALSAIGYAERAPTLTELYATGPFIGVLQQGTSRLIGDPNLAKEQLGQFDVGLRADYDWARAGVTGFYADIHNYITYDANKLGPGLTQVVYTNTDRATLAGGEAFAIVDVTSWLTPFGNAAYVQGIDQTHIDNRRPPNIFSSRANNLVALEQASATEPLPQIPPFEIRAGVRVHQPIEKSTDTPKWTVEFSARVDWGQNEIARSLGELPTPGFTVFDIRSFWQVNKSLLLSAGVENFGDKLYRAHLDPISGNILGVDPLFRPGTNFYFASQLTY
jgi:outer membrane receptor protein involved in Fe transport